MLKSKKQLSVLAVAGLLMSMSFTGCATRGYARRQARDVDNKVTALAAVVQENAERLDATDARARQGIADAGAARSAAAAAQATANQAAAAAGASQSAAAAAQAAAEAANQSAQSASARAPVTTFQGNTDRYNPGPVTIVMFKAGKAELSKDAMKALDEVVAPIASQEGGYLVEIVGFASAEGADAQNVNLSQERSEAVQRYMVNKGASLTRTSIVGLGSEKPIGDNKTKSGREQNRRAEVRVHSAAK